MYEIYRKVMDIWYQLHIYTKQLSPQFTAHFAQCTIIAAEN